MNFCKTLYKSFYLFFLALILTAGIIEQEVTFDRDDISFTEIKEYDFIKLEGCGSTTRKIGAPCLPRASFSLLIPQGTEVMDVEVISFDKEEIRGEYDIYPTQHPQPFIRNKVFPFTEPDTDIYSQTVPYPEEIVENSTTGSMSGYRLASVLVYPLQYIPSEKKLVFYSRIKFKITYEEKLRSLKTKTEKQNKIFGERVKNLILNPESMGMFEPFVGMGHSLDLPPDTVEYVIITVDSFASTFQELADWKIKKGVPAKVVTLDSIYANYTGVDNSERVRNFIIDANSSWGTIWVLLGGQCDYEWGQEIVPRRNVYYITSYGGNYPDEDTIPTDLYFSDLDGDWNADGDGVFGESTDNVDLYSDVFVGRAPVRTVSQAEEFVEKVLTYEKRPPSGYLKKILLPAAYLWPGLYDERTSQEAIADMVPGDWQVSRMYERDGDLTQAAFVDSVRSGFGFAHLVGHGDEDGVYTYYADAYFESDDLDALGNDSLLGIHNSIACMAGGVDLVPYGDCFAEHYLTPSTGGSYSIMNSRYGWGNPPNMGPSEHIDTCFYHEIFTEDYTYHDHIGVAHAFSKDGYVSEVTWTDVWAWCIYELNLFGDPEMPLWTDEPGELTVIHDAVIPVGGSFFSVNVSDGASPVEGALVCLYKESEVYEKGYSDALGNITLTLLPAPNSLGTMYCTATKSNYIPYEGTVDVISPSGPWVIFEQYTVIDISGNNDGNVDPGESIELQLIVHNVGLDSALSISGILRTEDAYVTITDSVEDFGDILADSLAVSLEDFDFDVLPGCPINHVINFELVASDINDSTWNSFFSVPISTPDISLSTDTLDFDTTYIGYPDTLELLINNNGGDTLFVSNITSDNIEYSVDNSNFNIPPYESQSVGVIFSPTSESVSTGNLTIESDDPDDSLLTVFLQGGGLLPPDISVSPDSLSDSLFTGETSVDTLTIYNNGSSDLNFYISIEFEPFGPLSSAQKSVSTSGERPVPLIEIEKGEEDTRVYPMMALGQGGPDGFGYRWKDSNEPGGPVFNWIDVSGGTSISLSDDDFQTGIPLGFTFNYYGTDFNTIGVGSNGWLSFNGSNDWYPSNVPAVDSYDGAIAPFARDLYPPLASYIRYQTFGSAPNRYLVIEYNNIPNYGGGNNKTFEVIFYENSSKIKFQYLIAPDDPYGFGIESPDETMGMGNAGVDSLFISPTVVENNYAIEFSLAPDWISLDTPSGSITAGDSVFVEVTFDATYLIGGDYFADITIASNDPDESEVIVPAHLNVTGVPDITVSADTMDFGIVFTGYSSTDTLIISNEGTDILTVSDISSDNPDYAVDTTNFTINSGETQAVAVICSPSTVGLITGNLTISSDDPDESTVSVFLQAEGLEPPDISVSPDSLSDSLFTGETSTHTLTIYNTGTSDLNFAVSIEAMDSAAVLVEVKSNTLRTNLLDSDRHMLTIWEANGIDESAYIQLLNKSSDTKNQGKKLLQHYNSGDKNTTTSGSTLSNAMIEDFETGIWPWAPWISVGGGGSTTLGCAHDGTQGILDPDWYYRTDVTVGSPGDVLSTWVKPGDGRYYMGFGASASGTWSLVAAANTNQLIIQENDGYLFENIASVTQSWTYDVWYKIEITFENDSLVIGRLYASDGTTLLNTVSATLSGFAPGGVAIRSFDDFCGDTFEKPSALSWVSVDTTSGTIPAGDSTLIEVTFDATGLYGGDYFADIIIASNDPDESEVIVPAHLHVTGAPAITISADTLDCGIVYPGSSVTDTLIVANEGTDTLTVSDISSDNGDYTIDTTNFILAPEEDQPVLVTFTPSSMGIITGLLIIESNDPDDSTLTIYMRGECAEPPNISVSPDSLSDTLSAGETSTHTLTIYNTGASDLNFDITIGGVGSSYALEFDGVDGYVEVPDHPSLSAIGGAFTLECWINAEEDPILGRKILGKWGSGGSSDDEFDLDFPSSGGILEMAISGSSGGMTEIRSNPISPYTWTHVAGVFDSASTSYKLFINGILDSNMTPSTITMNRDTYQPFRMGTSDFTASNFRGQMDEVRIWNVARTEGEIQANMYRELGGSEPGLIGYWNFNEGAGDTAYDYSPNNNDGTLYGGATWVVSSSPVVNWIYVDTTSGTVSAGDSMIVEVTFDATGMEAGNYYADIIIASNDPDTPELIVPAHLHVLPVGIEEEHIPKVFFIEQNYPNPFSANTAIQFGCPEPANVRLIIYDIMGRVVNVLIDSKVEAGYHTVNWYGTTKSGEKIANAVYFYRMETDKGFNQTKKMILLK